MNKAKKFLENNQYGQTMVEIVAVIAIGTILILALVALSVRSNRGADFSKVESQASKLASEGVEIIRNLKAFNGNGVRYDLNCGGVFSSTYNWSSFYGIDDGGSGLGLRDSCTSVDTHGKRGYLHRTSAECDSSNEAWCLTFGGSGSESVPPIDGRTFERFVYIADTPISAAGKSQCNSTTGVSGDWGRIKQFTVVVTWTDTSGEHNVTNTTCLQKI